MQNDVRTLIDESPISAFQLSAIGICFVILMLDGFDALAMAFTGPTISTAWRLNGTELGVLFSASLVGMAIGAIAIAPAGDLYGRRLTVIVSLVLASAGMLFSATSSSLLPLAAMRFLTGVGVGTALASVNILVAEYAPARHRGLAIGIVQTGYPLGAMLGGVLAAMVIPQHGWQSVFLAGALASAAMIPVAVLLLPESVDFLLARQPRNALAAVNRQLRRMGHDELRQLPDMENRAARAGPRGLFTPQLRVSTLLLWSAFFMVMFCLYFVLNWTPKLLVASGLSTEQGISGGVLLHIGGIVGQIAFGFLAIRFRMHRLLFVYFGTGALAMLAFSLVLDHLVVALLVGGGIGFCVLGAITGCYAVTHGVYPTEARTTALGWAIGIGRIGAIVSPVVAGVLLDDDVTPAMLYVLFALPMVLGMLAIGALAKRETAH